MSLNVFYEMQAIWIQIFSHIMLEPEMGKKTAYWRVVLCWLDRFDFSSNSVFSMSSLNADPRMDIIIPKLRPRNLNLPWF